MVPDQWLRVSTAGGSVLSCLKPRLQIERPFLQLGNVLAFLLVLELKTLPRELSLQFLKTIQHIYGFLGGSVVKNPPAMQEMQVQSLDGKDPTEKEMATHASILAWEILWTEEPGGLQSLGSQKR